MLNRRQLIATAATGLAASALPNSANAQLLNGTVRMVVGFPPGGPTDTVANKGHVGSDSFAIRYVGDKVLRDGSKAFASYQGLRWTVNVVP